MTWSIIAREAGSGRVGIAVATRFFAVGSRVPHIRTGVGAVATQAFVNKSYGPRGLDLMAGGLTAGAALDRLVAADSGRDHRQVHLMDAAGASAAYTGSACIDWCGHHIGADFSVAGNMLAGSQVIARTAEAFTATAGQPLARRLIAAMRAGEAAGGDKRGRQSAALLVHDAEEFPIYDIRVDDHADPLTELARLHAVARERFVHFRRRMPSRAHPDGIVDRHDLEDFIAASIAEGYE
ncbi:MAG: DUF1028 domain-containing protein [Hyphomicrobiaceae bacterium]